jgi:hypothetical protein
MSDDDSVTHDDHTEGDFTLATSKSSSSSSVQDDSDRNNHKEWLENEEMGTPRQTPNVARAMSESPIPHEISFVSPPVEASALSRNMFGMQSACVKTVEDDAKPQAAVVTTAKKPRTIHSKAHDDLMNDKCVFFSVDVETGGEHCGIVQISAVEIHFSYDGTDYEFDMYVNPGPGAKWDSTCTSVTGLSPNDNRIQNAGSIETVWPQFVEFIESQLDNGAKKGIIVAWNGKACEMDVPSGG